MNTSIGQFNTDFDTVNTNTSAAAASALLAESWAEEDEDVEVAAGQYSAKHHASKAAYYEGLMAPHYDDINVVSTNIASVNTTATDIANVNTTATDIANVNTTATNITGVNTVATDILKVVDVADTVVPNINEILLADDNATIATTKATEASDSAAAAEASKNTAYLWAEEDVDVEVSTGEYSAKHYKTKAGLSATEANHWANYPEDTLVPEGNLVDEYSAKHYMQKAQAVVADGVLYMGQHDASGGNYPDSPATGNYWKISVAGTLPVGDVFENDGILYHETYGWSIIDNTERVQSVAGRIGNIVLVESDITNLDKYTQAEVDNLIASNTAYNYSTKTAASDLFNKDFIYADTSGGAFTLTLPAAPVANARIHILDSTSSFAANNLTLARNGNNILGLAEDLVLDANDASIELIYTGIDWRIV